MIEAGFETTEPKTGTVSRVIKGARETERRGWVIEVTCPEGASPAILEHVHTRWAETFEILQGRAQYRLDGREHRLDEGDTVFMPPGQPHIHPWNAGTSTTVYRQTNDFGETCPEAVRDVLGVFATLNALELQGKLNAKGLPKNPLQFAATLRTLVRHGGFDAAAPVPAQRLLAATLGRFAELLGYRAVRPDLFNG